MKQAIDTLPTWLQKTLDDLLPHLPSAAGAVAIVIGFWLLALIARRVVHGALTRCHWDNKLAESLGYKEFDTAQVEDGVSRVAYYLILALGLVALLEYLGLDEVTKPLVGALERVAGAAPALIQAGVIALVGYAIARLASAGTRHLLAKTRLVQRIDRFAQPADEESEARSEALTHSISRGVFWVILFVVAIPVLGALQVSILAESLGTAIFVLSTFAPKVLGAALLVLTGWVLGRIVQVVVKTLVSKIGVETWLVSARLLKEKPRYCIGDALGTLAMAFITLNFSISALGRLGIEEISQPLGLVLDQIYGYLPRLAIAALLAVIALVVSRTVARMSTRVAQTLGFDALLRQLGVGTLSKNRSNPPRPQKGETALGQANTDFDGHRMPEGPSEIAGAVLGATVFLLFSQQILLTLDLNGLAHALSGFIEFVPSILASAAILAFGAWSGSWVRRQIDRLTRETTDAFLRALGPIARGVVLVITVMVALEQLGIAGQSVSLAFTVTFGAISLALALAFGLGGRSVAARILEQRYAQSEASRQSETHMDPSPGE